MRMDAALGCLPLVAAVVLAGTPADAQSQSTIGTVSGGAALVTTLGNRHSAMILGGGAEVRSGTFGLGGEVDSVYFPRTTRTLEQGRGTATEPATSMPAVTVRGLHYFGEYPAGRTRPFVSGGFSFLGKGDFGMVLIGAGVDLWTSRRAGIRLEVREQFPIMLAFRGGIVFR